jgi:hypothetical protein
MYVKLLAATALLVISSLVFYQLYCNCPMLSQTKTPVHTAQAGRQVISAALAASQWEL